MSEGGSERGVGEVGVHGVVRNNIRIIRIIRIIM